MKNALVNGMAIPMPTSNGQCRRNGLMTVLRVCGDYHCLLIEARTYYVVVQRTS